MRSNENQDQWGIENHKENLEKMQYTFLLIILENKNKYK
jgi:hypothetical protein